MPFQRGFSVQSTIIFDSLPFVAMFVPRLYGMKLSVPDHHITEATRLWKSFFGAQVSPRISQQFFQFLIEHPGHQLWSLHYARSRFVFDWCIRSLPYAR